MAILRTETKTVPAQTFETTIIGIPAEEWKSMRLWKGTFCVAPILIMLSLLFGIMAFMLNLLPALMQAGEIGSRTEAYSLMAITLFIVLAGKAMLYSIKKCTRLEPDLLTKHGWDGSTPYRVVLEYQIRMD